MIAGYFLLGKFWLYFVYYAIEIEKGVFGFNIHGNTPK